MYSDIAFHLEHFHDISPGHRREGRSVLGENLRFTVYRRLEKLYDCNEIQVLVEKTCLGGSVDFGARNTMLVRGCHVREIQSRCAKKRLAIFLPSLSTHTHTCTPIGYARNSMSTVRKQGKNETSCDAKTRSFPLLVVLNPRHHRSYTYMYVKLVFGCRHRYRWSTVGADTLSRNEINTCRPILVTRARTHCVCRRINAPIIRRPLVVRARFPLPAVAAAAAAIKRRFSTSQVYTSSGLYSFSRTVQRPIRHNGLVNIDDRLLVVQPIISP